MIDLAILVVWTAGVAAWGAWLGRGVRGGEGYFLGDRSLPWVPVLLSIVATETSTLTFLSVPAIAYGDSLVFLQLSFGYLIGRVVVAAVLLPRYAEGRLETAYALLAARFGDGARRFASSVFMVTRVLADGVRLFATGIPLALLTGWPLEASIVAIGVLSALYTLIGGIRAVVWVDAVQAVTYLAGAIVAVVLLGVWTPGGWPEIAASAAEAGKLAVVDLRFDLGAPYTLWAGLIGGAFLSMASHGADQIIVQRVLACRDLGGARRAMVGSGLAVIVQFALFLAIGIGLWSYYGGRPFDPPDAVFATFIVEALPAGVAGLLVAGVFSAAMSTISSSIGALSSASTYDLWLPRAGAVDEATILRVGRWSAAVWAALLVLAALAFDRVGSDALAVEVALAVASLVYGGLLGGFALALAVPAATGREAVPAMAAGIGAVFAIWVLAPDAVAWPWFVPIGTAVTVATGAGLALARSGSLRGHGR